MKATQFLPVMLSAFLIGLIVAAAPVGWDFVRRRQLEAAARQALSADVRGLYVPPSVAELYRHEGTFVNLAGYECADGLLTLVYGSARPPADIQADYLAALGASGWAVDPGYRPSDNYFVYQHGPKRKLSLDFLAPEAPVDTQGFATVFTVRIDNNPPDLPTCYQ